MPSKGPQGRGRWHGRGCRNLLDWLRGQGLGRGLTHSGSPGHTEALTHSSGWPSMTERAISAPPGSERLANLWHGLPSRLTRALLGHKPAPPCARHRAGHGHQHSVVSLFSRGRSEIPTSSLCRTPAPRRSHLVYQSLWGLLCL